MFATGLCLFAAVSVLAAILGKDAPYAVKWIGSVSWCIGLVLMFASVVVAMWRAMP